MTPWLLILKNVFVWNDAFCHHSGHGTESSHQVAKFSNRWHKDVGTASWNSGQHWPTSFNVAGALLSTGLYSIMSHRLHAAIQIVIYLISEYFVLAAIGLKSSKVTLPALAMVLISRLLLLFCHSSPENSPFVQLLWHVILYHISVYCYIFPEKTWVAYWICSCYVFCETCFNLYPQLLLWWCGCVTPVHWLWF